MQGDEDYKSPSRTRPLNSAKQQSEIMISLCEEDAGFEGEAEQQTEASSPGRKV
eukprot:CAMPEP_0170451192 /NCGR_PEP_ID=MMETSP0123-20130129/516_1 /TAXON_ID=182087 /ORGANISM="Favella ehrenbergii, Strain Fehren 1" /LENGTH=53 /DNA_ID=CAMNT_0010712803 /DNA_START=478 /DNA_END=639 /DNA_ORIENTATION=-